MLKTVRDDNWLISRLDSLWSNHFADVPQTNRVFIKFGRVAKYRFGSIRFDPKKKDSLILINGLFRDNKVPQEVVDHTIAHELVHYTHGFSSPHKKMYSHPHKGGVIDKEMEKRGLITLIKAYKSWLKAYRKSFTPKVRLVTGKRRLRFRIKFI